MSHGARTVAGVLALVLVALPAVARGQSCAGDCDGNGVVTIADLTVMVNISLGTLPPSACPAGADGGDGITVSDIVRAVQNAFDGCPGDCGTCPDGSTCGSANGHGVCRAPSGVPRLSHIFVIVMENTSLGLVQGSGATPYLDQLAATTATSSNYHAVARPSLPNYLTMTSGQGADVGCDCAPAGTLCTPATCNDSEADCGCPQAVDSIADAMDAAGVTWRSYAEDMGAPCTLVPQGQYVPHHVPFLYYPSIAQNPQRCAAGVVDYGRLAADLAGATPRFVFITPNLTHDMHDPLPATAANLANGDAWLASELPHILDSAAYRDGGIVFIVWDEPSLDVGPATADPVPLFVVSPLARQGGYVSTAAADHYALLATWTDALGLPRLGAAQQATPLADFFPPQ